jgi:hypothetical protein
MTNHYRLTPYIQQFNAVKDIFVDYGGVADGTYFSMNLLDDDQQLEIMHNFTGSREFRHSFSSNERDRSLGAFAAAVSGEPWRIGSQRDDSGLFTLEIPEKTLSSNLYDGLVLSGALGWHYDDDRDLLEFGVNHDMGARETYQIVGATASVIDELWLRGYYARDYGSFRAEQYIGADLHGDFRTVRTISAAQQIIAPGGEYVEFAPLVSREIVRGYHSTELTIVRALLEQLQQALPVDIYNSAARALLERLPSQDKENRSLFADFGDDSGDRLLPLRTESIQEGEVLESFIDAPGSSSGVTKLIYNCEGLVFSYSATGSNGEFKTVMTIPNEEITDFIVALGHSGQGRTSVHHIHQLVAQTIA